MKFAIKSANPLFEIAFPIEKLIAINISKLKSIELIIS
jgi:hypothetical protein